MDWPPEMPSIDYRYLLSLINKDLYWLKDIQYEHLIQTIMERPAIFIAGVGRSGLIAKMFAMRLMHCGINHCYVVGDVTTPSIQKDDLLLIVSGSGETSQLVQFATKARQLEALTTTVTATPNSTIAKLCDHVYPIGANHDNRVLKNIAPMGTRFELAAFIFLETLILKFMETNHITEQNMKKRHANLE